MTRIVGLRVVTHCNDIGGKVWNPAIRWTKKYAVFVVLTDDAGREGLGECWCFDTAPDALCAYLRTEVAPHFVGLPMEDVEAVARQLTVGATLTARHGILAAALSGIDIAAHDLRAQAEGLPLWKTLDPAGPGQVNLYASGGLYGEGKDAAALAREFEGIASEGFTLAKMKIGALDMIEDVARVRAVLNTLPHPAKLIIDGVYSYDTGTAQRVFDALPAERIEAFQSPLPATDIAGMARLRRGGVPVMATEAEYRSELHDRLVGEGAVAFLQTAPIAVGGISRLCEMTSLVRNTPTQLSLEISSTAVALMAACHIAAADKAIAHVEYHSLHRVFFDQLALSRCSGFPDACTLPTALGLGLTLPQEGVTSAFALGETADHPERQTNDTHLRRIP